MVTTLLANDFWGAFLNVLGIVGLILLAIFIVVFVTDWILSTVDGKEGIFFKKNKHQENNITNITNNYGDNYNKPEEKEEFVKTEEVKEEKTTEEIDFEKARQEELELNQAIVEEPVPESIVEPQGSDYEAMIEEINNTAMSAYYKVKSEELARKVLGVESAQPYTEKFKEEAKEHEEVDEIVEEEVDESNDEVEAVEEEIEEPIEKINEEYAEDLEDDDIDDEDLEEEPVEAEEKTEYVENTEAQNEILKRLEEQVNELKRQLEEQQRENENLKRIAEEEKAKLNELIAKRNNNDGDDEGRKLKDYVGNLDELEARLEILKERLKANEKELRINKKEYIPLARVKKNLESDKKKLRRREAIVAKRKVLLYGVNNYADIDEEKAKELNEELDLLEGLRLSVAHCEEVMEANKDRYPILEHTNKILTETNSHIKADIAQVEEEIEGVKKRQEEGQEN